MRKKKMAVRHLKGRRTASRESLMWKEDYSNSKAPV